MMVSILSLLAMEAGGSTSCGRQIAVTVRAGGVS